MAPGSTVFTGADSDLKPIFGATLDNNYTFFGRRGHVNELPVVAFTTSLTQFPGGYAAYNPATILSGYPASKNKMGPCYSSRVSKSIPAAKLNPQGYVNGYNQYSLGYSPLNFGPGCPTTKIPQSDKKVYKVSTDNRYNLVDNLDLETFLLQSFEVKVSFCYGAGAGAGAILSAFNVSGSSYLPTKYYAKQDPDMYSRGFASLPGYVTMEQYLNAQGGCSSNDPICNAVLSQTMCGRYVHAAHAMNAAYGGVTTTYGIYNEPEVFWESTATASTASGKSSSKSKKSSSSKSSAGVTCPKRSDILSKITSLKAAIAALEAVMIVSVIVGFMSGIVGPIYSKLQSIVVYSFLLL